MQWKAESAVASASYEYILFLEALHQLWSTPQSTGTRTAHVVYCYYLIAGQGRQVIFMEVAVNRWTDGQTSRREHTHVRATIQGSLKSCVTYTPSTINPSPNTILWACKSWLHSIFWTWSLNTLSIHQKWCTVTNERSYSLRASNQIWRLRRTNIVKIPAHDEQTHTKSRLESPGTNQLLLCQSLRVLTCSLLHYHCHHWGISEEGQTHSC